MGIFKMEDVKKKISVFVNIEKNDCLSANIASNKRHLIQELSIIGSYCCEKDDETIRSMCNVVLDSGHRSGGQLETLDLSKAHIQGNKNANGYSMRRDSFNGCVTLKRILLSKLYNIDPRIFRGCTSLEYIKCNCETLSHINGVLYRRGKVVAIPDKYLAFDYGKWSLVKYPAAKQDVEDIRFDRISRIEDFAFEDFRGTDLYINSSVPPSCTEDAFYNVDVSKITIHVPDGAFNSYWSHPVWGMFQIEKDSTL
jgi:hypothetical protein